MLRIRLQRIGRKKKPHYRVVLAEHSDAVQRKSIELLGSYDPLAKENAFSVNVEKITELIKKGAKPTNTLARLLKGQGVKDMEPFIVEMKDKKKKKEEEKPKEEAKAAEAPAEVSKETVKEEKIEKDEKELEKAEEELKKAEEKLEEAKPEASDEPEKPKKSEKKAEPEVKKEEEIPAEEEKPTE